MVQAYQALIDCINATGIFPLGHILDNKCSALFKQQIQLNKLTYQLVPPHDHRRNRAKKAIQTFKDHFLSILCGTDPSFPLHLWDWLLSQVENTLNMLCPARTLKTISAYTYLYGQHDYNCNPFAPLGCKVEAHVVPEIYETWAPHTASGYYIGNAMEQYHCHNVYIPDTKGTHACSSVFFKHKYLLMPTLTPSDTLIKAADTLSEAITGTIPVSSITSDAITQLLNIFKQQANSAKDATAAQRVLTQQAQSQRVHTEQSNTFPQPVVSTQADELWMYLIESQPEFPPLEIEEQILEPENPIRTSMISQELVHNHSTPARNMRQQQQIQTITQDCAYHLMETKAASSTQKESARKYPLQFLCDWANFILDKEIGDVLEYRHLLKNPKYKEVWSQSFSREIHQLSNMTKTISFLTKPEIPQAQRKDITYSRIVCTYCSKKKDPY